MTFQSLLPGLASPLRRTVEEASCRPFEIEILLRDLDNPERVPESFLAFLAWGMSTDLWDRNWSIEKKRAVVKAWWRLHRLKGTLQGIKEAVRYFDAEVVAVRRPPDATYPDPSLTTAERDAYLAKFEQIRFYEFRSRGTANYGAYLSSGYRLPRLFASGKAFPAYSDAIERIGKRAFLYDPLTGEEVPVRRATRVTTVDLRQAVQFDEVFLPGKAGFSAFLDRPPMARVFTAKTGASGRRYTLQVDTTYSESTSSLHISGVLPAAQPISVKPRKAKVPGERVQGQLFPGGDRSSEIVARPADGTRRAFLPPSTAALRIFDQIFLYDPTRHVDRRHARTFLGSSRLGMPAYHARITLETRSKLSPFAAQRFVSGFLLTTDKSRLTRAIEAIRLQKSLRDKIIATAKTMRPARVGDGYRIGTINVGTWVRDL